MDNIMITNVQTALNWENYNNYFRDKAKKIILKHFNNEKPALQPFQQIY